ncbi:ABC transporter ATP-binding protein [Thauera linaloolentis]|uniref:ABC transporter n=1 Tax=Thauera linaloolentis (strain DSM 12138 / JCM 21573 / CCUG 41526 / CIP 105981 / IAM 15112 / NBRC 102519 / 47Lol) TaxID=1123367 RepID=N6Z8N7_THAL4|nr:ATP-binding cassette domain-containing protein [Thauera linaloolentis]ENO90723.1 ABC transporter [Thauera linaloolentis 47Lol = DSM 12138]MCM8565631.1 ATP-binding cassette domain-containing protein [Thauera linaloolentis]
MAEAPRGRGQAAPMVMAAGMRYRWPKARTDCLVIDELVLEAGERVFLRGPSGSGKSTLLSLIGGVIQPGAGTISVAGQPLASLSAGARDRFRADHVGFVFQLFNLLPYLSGRDNILLACRFSAARRSRLAEAGVSPEAEVARLAARLDLAREVLARPAAELSVGQQQRVAAARALIGRPGLVIADEPTSALDADRQQAFVDLLLGECAVSGAALLFVSHDLRLAAHFDRVLDLEAINHAAGAAEQRA